MTNEDFTRVCEAIGRKEYEVVRQLKSHFVDRYSDHGKVRLDVCYLDGEEVRLIKEREIFGTPYIMVAKGTKIMTVPKDEITWKESEEE